MADGSCLHDSGTVLGDSGGLALLPLVFSCRHRDRGAIFKPLNLFPKQSTQPEVVIRNTPSAGLPGFSPETGQPPSTSAAARKRALGKPALSCRFWQNCVKRLKFSANLGLGVLDPPVQHERLMLAK
jgi:hypothetical protein